MELDVIRDIYELRYKNDMSLQDYEQMVTKGFEILEEYNHDKLQIRIRCTLEQLQAVNRALEYNIAVMNRLIA